MSKMLPDTNTKLMNKCCLLHYSKRAHGMHQFSVFYTTSSAYRHYLLFIRAEKANPASHNKICLIGRLLQNASILDGYCQNMLAINSIKNGI